MFRRLSLKIQVWETLPQVKGFGGFPLNLKVSKALPQFKGFGAYPEMKRYRVLPESKGLEALDRI
jgi:hypothetical protein